MIRFPFYLILALLLGTACSKPIKPETSLFVEITSDNGNRFPFLSIDAIAIFKDGHFLQNWMISDRAVSEADTLFQKIGLGTYTFHYQNNLKQTLEKTVSINKPGEHHVRLLLDSSDLKKELKNSWIAAMKMNERLTLNLRSSGCFHARNDTLTLSRTPFGYMLQYHHKRMMLSNADVNFLIKFECELPLISNKGWCTSTDYYVLQYNGKEKRYIDGDCAWNGYYRIFKRFGLEAN